MRRRTRAEMPDATINMTSLLDITFVLLIAFMIVAPAVKYNIDMELPQVSESNNAEAKNPVSVQVAFDEEAGRASYYVNGQSTPFPQVAETIQERPDFLPDDPISLEGDRTVPWEVMTRLMNELTNNNINNISIVTKKGEAA